MSAEFFETRARIDAWSIPNGEKWALCIAVRVEPFGVRESFYRVFGAEQHRPDEWTWRRWSMAGKPTVRVNEECSGLLNRMLLQHPDLSLLLHLFGFSSGDVVADEVTP